MAAVVMDTPDLLVGHMFTTFKAMLPDLRSNVKTVARSAPVASMLLDLNLTERARQANGWLEIAAGKSKGAIMLMIPLTPEAAARLESEPDA
jgi:hypothetical protein